MRSEESVGIYLSIPFCRAKCSFCNFASGVFAEERLQGYVDRVCAEIGEARTQAVRLGAVLPDRVDTVYFGGGTPSLLGAELVGQIFGRLRDQFQIDRDAEVTVECAPGQLEDAALERYLREGMSRVSFGVQSFVDRESAAVGRLHTGTECLAELDRMRRAGIRQRSLDLIVGLPHQTEASWKYSVDEALASGVEHVSVYMLEVDEDSRLGREMLASGGRYGAGMVPEDDACAEWYAKGVEWLAEGGLGQYEISNFARVGCRSRHNVKYWTRAPYVGLGLDAHSMLHGGEGAVRWANPSEMEEYIGMGDGLAARAGAGVVVDRVGRREAFEETIFLGLRMNDGVDLARVREEFGGLVDEVLPVLAELEEAGMVVRREGVVRLSGTGRMVSNEVFERLLLEAV